MKSDQAQERKTGAEGKRGALQIDPLSMCPPLGAIYASQGIHACMPHSHGASGCCRFQRMELGRHFQKTIRVASSLLKESSAIFGGEKDCISAVGNVFRLYAPDMLALHSTCLSETIGDDLQWLASKADVPSGKHLVVVSTPGYVGSHLTGYADLLSAVVGQVVREPRNRNDSLCLMPGLLNPSDVAELKRYAAPFFDTVITFPDVCGVLDVKTPRDVKSYCPGGTSCDAIETLAESGAVIALGRECTFDAASALCELGHIDRRASLPIPVGIEATDEWMGRLRAFSGREVPKSFGEERQRTIDVLMKVYPIFFGCRAAVSCDADLSVPLVSFLAGVGIVPVYVATGRGGSRFVDDVSRALARYGLEGTVLAESDRYDLERFLERHEVDVIIGGSREKIVAARRGIPLMRIGFPVSDRPLCGLWPIVGYRGCLNLLRSVADVLLHHRESRIDPENLAIARYF